MDYTDSNYILMQSAQQSVAQTINSGNQLYDLIFTVLIMSIISTSINNFRGFSLNLLKGFCCYKKCRKLLQKRVSCFKKRSELIYDAALIQRNFQNTTMDTSKTFDAILDYINSNNFVDGVYSKSELRNKPRYNRNFYFGTINDLIENKKKKESITYFFSFGTVIKLGDEVFAEFTDRTESNNESIDGKNIETTRKISMIIIYSYTKNITYLENYVNKIFIRYCKKLDGKYSNQMFKLSYRGLPNEQTKTPVWKEIKFDTVKSIDNFFSEDKEKIFKQIENIRNSREEYKRIGKPFQIHILIHSPYYGCGKTSLLKLLAKMFGDGENKRHIIDINMKNVKTCSELEDIFYCNDPIRGQYISNNERIYVIDELDKASEILYKEKYKEYSLPEKRILSEMKKYYDSDKIDKKKENEFRKLIDFSKEKTTVENHPNDDSLNLGFILELLDGPIEFNGRIMIFTANDINKLHPALLRPGRIDVNIKLKLANRDIIKQIISHIYLYENWSYDLSKALNEIDEYRFSHSYIMTICLERKNHRKYTNISEKEYDILNVIDHLRYLKKREDPLLDSNPLYDSDEHEEGLYSRLNDEREKN